MRVFSSIFLLNTLGREQIGVAHLARVVLKVLKLHKSLVHQRAQTIIRFTEAHAELAGQGALAEIGIGFKGLERAQGQRFIK
jgi:hypothetical protein